MAKQLSLPDMEDPDDGSVDVEVDDDPMEGMNVVENSDGTADVFDPEEEEPQVGEFDENLAEVFDKAYLREYGSELKRLIDKDVDDRKKRDEQYADGIRRTGLGNDAPGGADFEGSSKAVHPMLAKGSVDFASRTIKELFPANGPCKSQIVGEQTEEKIDRAERKKKYMNWQMTTQIKENRAELERLLSQVPLGGAQYKRWWWDHDLHRPRSEAVFIDDVFMPYGHADFYTAPRIAIRQRINKDEFDARVRNGLYIDDPATSNPSIVGRGDESKSQLASDKVEGVDSTNALIYNEDGLRIVWQIEILVNEPNDPTVDKPVPYIIHLDDSSEMIVGYFRNWKEDDKRYRKKDWTSEWPFIPWRGGPAVGLAHLIGSLAAASTGALRAILDASHINNFPGAVKLSGGRSAGESKSISPTEISEIDAPAGVDDIRKLIMPFPFNGPSTVLFQIMEWLTQQADMVVATASEKIADAGNNMPVGTSLALIEQGSINFSAVHARLHEAMKHDLEILHRLNAENMDDQETVEDLGELIVYRSDFEGPMDIIPVSDPNIFSETQRYAQLQAIIQLQAMPMFQQYFIPDQLLARALKLLNVPDVEGIANLPKETQRMSPLEENYALGMQERPLKVYEEQDDLSHLKSHVHFATSPMFGANPLMANAVMAPMLQHCKEHIMALYRKHTKAATQQFLMEARMRGIDMGPDEAEVYGGAFVDQLLSQQLGPMIMPGLQQMQQIVQQLAQASAPKPSPDILAQTQAQTAIEQAKIASTEKIRMGEANLKGMIEKMNMANDQANRDSQEKLAQMATSIEYLRDQQKAGSDMIKTEFLASQETQITVLKSVLDAALGQMQQANSDMAAAGAAEEAGSTDLANRLIEPLLGALQTTLADSINGMSGADSPMMAQITGLQEQQKNFEQILQQQAQATQQAFSILAQGLSHVVTLAKGGAMGGGEAPMPGAPGGPEMPPEGGTVAGPPGIPPGAAPPP